MKVLININHPAHVHLFRNAIQLWREDGHDTIVVARDKDVTLALLDHYGIRFTVGSKARSGLVGQMQELFIHTKKILDVARRTGPSVLVSMGSPMAAWASAVLRVPHLAMDDTEHARLEHALYRPFTAVICTPEAYKQDLGRKQIRYKGYQELAYLHPNYFRPDPAILDDLGLDAAEPYAVVRLVSWEAAHDRGHHGISADFRSRLVQTLGKNGRVFISSERPLPDEFEPHRVTVPPHRMHDLLAFAQLYVGEGATMASEAAILGTPAVYINSLSLGYLEEQEAKYGLVFNITDPENAVAKAEELLGRPGLEQEFAEKRQAMLAEKIDVTAFICDTVREYESAGTVEPAAGPFRPANDERPVKSKVGNDLV